MFRLRFARTGSGRVARGLQAAPATLAQQQEEDDRTVEEVPADTIDESRLVAAGRIEDRAREPAAERHPDQGRGERETDADTRFARIEELAHDDRVGGNDAALDQSEERRDGIQR